MKSKLQSILGMGALTLALNANAQSVFNGLRGPTNFQIDDRAGYSSKESQAGQTTETTGNNFLLKYWNGTNSGLFGFVNVPYKKVESGTLESEGLGDVTFGVGPRFETRIGEAKLGILSYAGASLATGDEKEKPSLGTGRDDFKAGILGTLLSGSKKYEADFGLDYLQTKGRKVSNEINGGIVLGGKVHENLRFVAGPVFNYKEGGENDSDYSSSGRLNLRFTPEKGSAIAEVLGNCHFELWYDRFIDGKGASAPKENNTITLIGRLNLGKTK
ncbi:hypothetical protein KA107_02265 [Candidatus Pacearchaeota archaeon]|nr:hypothetical protein [Candidatus Pacearchaeota archaeon]